MTNIKLFFSVFIIAIIGCTPYFDAVAVGENQYKTINEISKRDQRQISDLLINIKAKSAILGIDANINENKIFPINNSEEFLTISTWTDEIVEFRLKNGNSIYVNLSEKDQTSNKNNNNMKINSANSLTTENIPTEYWDEKLHVTKPGSSTYYIKYSRNHNIADANPAGPSDYYPGQYNLHWTESRSWPHWSTNHLSIYQISQTKNLGTLNDVLMVVIGGAILAGPAGWLLSAILTAIVAIMAVAPWVLIDAVETENGDGFSWTRQRDYWACGFWCTHWYDLDSSYGGGLFQSLWGRGSWINLHLII